MFDATAMLHALQCTKRLDGYIIRKPAIAIIKGLQADGVPDDDIMRASRGNVGRTLLHDYFITDFAAWIGGDFYYLTLKRLHNTTRSKIPVARNEGLHLDTDKSDAGAAVVDGGDEYVSIREQ